MRIRFWVLLIIDNDNQSGSGREGEVYLALPLYFFSLRFLFTAGGADKRDKKERFVVLNKTAHLKMLPEFYLNYLKSQLSASQLLTLEMLVWVLQFHKQVRIERLASCFPLPILYESRRRHVQRFLVLPQLSIPLLWFPLIKRIILAQLPPGTQVIIAIDRTQWKENNLFVVSIIWHKRAWPIYWQFLSHKGSSNLAQQQALLRPVFRLLKGYEIVVIGDREFRSVELAYWLKHRQAVLLATSR